MTKTAARVRRVPLDDVREAPSNVKSHDVDLVATSIRRFGFADPLVVDQRTDELLAGHGRVAALRRMRDADESPPDGITDDWRVPVYVGWASSDDLEADAARVALNRTTEAGGWEETQLLDLLDRLSEVEDGLDGVGFDDGEIDVLRRRLADLDGPSEGLTDPDDAPTPPVEVASKVGDVWILGDHRLAVGDSCDADTYDRLLGDETADLIFTDPPYGIGYQPAGPLGDLGKLENDRRSGRWQDFDEFTEFLDAAIGAMLDRSRPGAVYYICMGWEHLHDVVDAVARRDARAYSVLVWDRMTPRFTPYPQDFIPVNELMVYGWLRGAERLRMPNGPQKTTIWRFRTGRASEMEHTTQKPVDLVANALLNSSEAGYIVLDPFGGSGTTLIACEQHGRAARLIELDRRYADVIVRRWQQFTGRQATHAETGEAFDYRPTEPLDG